ncbi:MAG: MATE family efflux transporter [Clostridia bacterium]|nr:MATE family efflux transporter [Clostridia bacterium]
MNQKTELFEKTAVPKALATLAIPTIISQLITMVYNLADTFFIGLTDDPYKVAASHLSFVLVFAMGAISNLFGVGGGSLISRLMGSGKSAEAKKVSSFSFYGTVAVTLIYSMICLVFMHPVLNLVGASENTYGYASSYVIWVVVLGGVPTAVSMSLAHLLRSEGYAKFASLGLGMGGVLNILLDPLFMFVLLPKGQEVAGAAIATCISNTASCLYFLITLYVLKEKSVLSLSPKYLLPGFAYLKQVFSTGIPSALGSLLASTSNLVLNQLSSSYGDFELAALGIVKKIDMLPLNVGMGLCQGMLPLVAYNYASGDHVRMKKVISACRIAGMGFAALCILCFELFAGSIVRLFIQESVTASYGENFLRICCLATPLMFYNLLATYSLQAMGQGKESMVLSVCRQGLVNIPLLFVMNAVFHLYGVVSTQLVADSLTMIVSTVLLQRVYKKIKTPPAPKGA